MVNIFKLCCGEGEEESKFGSVYDPTDYGWTEKTDAASSKAFEQGSKIQTLESKIGEVQKHRQTVFSKPIVLDENFTPPVFPKTSMQKAFLSDILQGNFLFLDVADQEKEQFIMAMQRQDFEKGATIIQQGDVGDFFYIVAQGTVRFIKDGAHVGSTSRGGSFGELALLYDAPRAASCEAETDVSVYKVDQQTFRLMLAHHAGDRHQDIRELIRGISIFKDLDEPTLNRFTRAMTPVNFKEGDLIVKKGGVGNVFYIVQQGQVKIHDIGLGDSKFEDQILRPGDWFGERALLTGEPRAANVTAMSEVVLLAMDRNTFETTIGSLQELMSTEMKKKFLKGLQLFAKSNVTEPEIQALVGLMEEVTYKKGTQLASSGKQYDLKLWIIRHGQLLVMQPKSGKIFDLQSGDHFGDKSICGDPARISSHNAVCESDLTAWVLTRESIVSVVCDIGRLGQPQEPTHLAKEKPFLFKDLKKLKVLGQGAFGKVWLVEHKESGENYALKTIGKLKIIQAKQEDSVVREKELLMLLDHPFILRLKAAFQDEYNLYLMLPLISGGELFSVLHRQKAKGAGLPNNSAAFYSACIIEGLGHFHQRFIAYRDLKLENVLIDNDGYCIIVDLGFAKVVEDKTFTLVGTPEYLAPEIILSKGHDKAVDYWSFGILCYELLVGVSPFYKRGSSQIDMFKRIVMGKYKIPPFVDQEASDLIQKLLKRREMERLGNLSHGYLDIKSHPWYTSAGVDFPSVLKKESEAPWVPDPNPISNFDDFSSLENERETGRKLKKEEQDKFKDF